MNSLKLYIRLFFLILFFVNRSFAQIASAWFYQESPSTEFCNDVKFIDADNGIIAGANGMILKTTNGGNNWVLISSGTNINLNSISIDSSDIYIAGNSGLILKSSNQGSSWFTLNTPTSENLNCIIVKNETGFAGGEGGTILRTTDAGLNWTSTFSCKLIDIRSISFINDNFLWATGQLYNPPQNSPYLFKSTNLGFTWDTITSAKYLLSGSSITFLDPLNGFLGYCTTVLDYDVLATNDGGQTWECGEGLIHSNPISIFFINSLTGFSVGEGIASITAIAKTINGANHWYPSVAPGIWQDLKAIYFVNESTGWAVGWKILKTTTGGEIITNLITSSENIPQEFSLYQNYPNPFNPTTKIKFDIPKTSFTKLFVYNSEGRILETLYNGDLNGGSYEINFNASNYPSGIYFYKLETNGFTLSKKMLLVK